MNTLIMSQLNYENYYLCPEITTDSLDPYLRMIYSECLLITISFISLILHDGSLAWDTTALRHIPNIRIPSTQLYLPDLMSYNSVDYGSPRIINTNAIVYRNGNVLWVPPMTLKAMCRVNLKRWPFDEHICFIKFGSWTHDGYIMDVFPMNRTNPGLLNDIWKNTEFDISYINVTRDVKFYD
ncbi:unnamed protein product, partial [Medioppia subpectinata]